MTDSVQEVFLQVGGGVQIPLKLVRAACEYSIWSGTVPAGMTFRPVATNCFDKQVTIEISVVMTGNDHRASVPPGQTTDTHIHLVHRITNPGDMAVIQVAIWTTFDDEDEEGVDPFFRLHNRLLQAHHTIRLVAVKAPDPD